MRLASPWTPRLSDITGRPYERLIEALADDIASGLVPGGARLPPHRELAFQLGIGLGTVTKAYAILERRGLVQSVQGRGMFVAGAPLQATKFIDLSISTPPQMLSDRLLAATLVGLAKRLGAESFGTYLPAAGRHEHRLLMARWLAGQGLSVTPDRLFLCNGAQHALSVAFATACRPGGTLLTEAMTYPGAITLARHGGYRMSGLDMDAQGIMPQALEAALQRENAPHALYVTPTLQNPTAATMGLARRQDIVRLCRGYDVTIIEDDVYSIFASSELPPLAELAPERTLYVSGLSKALTPGLRIGCLAVPALMVETALMRLQATVSMASPLACMMMEQWLADGTADAVASAIRTEIAKRHVVAQSLLPRFYSPQPYKGLHIWLPMPVAEAENLAEQANAAGIRVMSPVASLVDAKARQSGIRLSLGTPPIDLLKQALTVLAALLQQGQPSRRDQPSVI